MTSDASTQASGSISGTEAQPLSPPLLPPLSPGETAAVFARHLTALYLPLNALAFLWTGPHPWYIVPLFLVPVFWIMRIDSSGRSERYQPIAQRAAWPFDSLVYVLIALQVLLIVETARFFSVQNFFSLDMLMAAFIVVGGSSGFSIITAHELIHRTARWEQLLGRLALCTVLYEHFYTEHLRGHHVKVGTAEDPATAKFGESFEAFFRRTVPAQFRSAWRLEKSRLEDPKLSTRGGKLLHNRILQGLVFECGIATAILVGFGPAAFVVFLLQAFIAVRALEAVNYFEHWGLTRRGPRVRTRDSWDTHSTFTYYSLIGLSRHADHHARPTRPYQRLRVVADAPLLPFGYIGTIDMVVAKNREYQELAAQELARARLGPFEPEFSGEVEGEEPMLAPIDAQHARHRLEQAHDEHATNRSSGAIAVQQVWRRLPLSIRRIFVFGGIILAATAGAQWETGAREMGFLARILLHAWILGVFASVIALGKLTAANFQRESLGWAAGLTMLLVLGMLTERIV